jgi:hypothetical protein
LFKGQQCKILIAIPYISNNNKGDGYSIKFHKASHLIPNSSGYGAIKKMPHVSSSLQNKQVKSSTFFLLTK